MKLVLLTTAVCAGVPLLMGEPKLAVFFGIFGFVVMSFIVISGGGTGDKE